MPMVIFCLIFMVLGWVSDCGRHRSANDGIDPPVMDGD